MLQHFDTVMSFAVVMLLLSLLVTTLVQMILAATQLRGLVLQWGIEKLLKQLSPDLKDHAEAIAEAVLTHPMIHHAGERRATSIRQEELLRLLDDLARDGSVLDNLPVTKNALKKVLGAAHAPEFTLAAQQLKASLQEAFPQGAQQWEQAVDDALTDTRKVATDVSVWFDTVMDRTTEYFLSRTRWITVAVALVLSFYLHVDSLSIIRQLASHPEIRARLVQSADDTLRKAENTFALTVNTQAIASAAIAAVATNYWTNAEARLLAPAPKDLLTRGAGEDWLNTALRTSTNRVMFLAAYGEQFDERTKVWLGALTQSAKNLNTSLRESDLMIIPNPPPPWEDYVQRPGHFLGTLMTVFFLSLGAPFWYNALRQLANLRPSVAEKIEPKSGGRK